MMNHLFPIFLKPENLRLVLVGGGEVGGEKLRFLLKSSPQAAARVVATWFGQEVQQQARQYEGVVLVQKAFEPEDLAQADVVIAATADQDLNIEVWKEAKKRGKLVNVADTPNLCDFYLGGIVTKGDLKIGISTNGKSPILAKRLRQFFEAELPEHTEAIIHSLHGLRKKLNGDFNKKLKVLDELTNNLIEEDK